MRRFDPGYLRAKALIDSGELGRIEQFRALSRDTFPAAARVPADQRRLVPRHGDPRSGPRPLPRGRGRRGPRLGERPVRRPLRARRTTGTRASSCSSSATAPWASWRRRATPSGATTSGPRSRARRPRWSWTARRRRRPRSPAASGWEGDLYESFPDRFADAYRRELEAFFADLGRRPDAQTRPGRRARDAPARVACTPLARRAAGAGRRGP